MKHCSLCDKDIEASRFKMHEIGCMRQNYKCKYTGKCVAKADREEHEADILSEAKCQYCDFKAPKYQFGDH